jgi:hypothetical protein
MRLLSRFTISLDLEIVAKVTIFYCVGIYGFPSFSLSHESNAGLIVRIMAILVSLALFSFWVKTLFDRKPVQAPKRTIKIQVNLKDVYGFILTFCILLFFWRAHLESSLTGDEIEFFGRSNEASIQAMTFLATRFENLSKFQASFTVGAIQAVIITVVTLFLGYLKKLQPKVENIFFVFAIICLYTLHNLIFNGSYSYPSLATAPYFLLSPIQLALGLNPRVISIVILAAFIYIALTIGARGAQSRVKSGILFICLLTTNLWSDIGLSLNHAVFAVYILGILLIIKIKHKVINLNTYLLSLIISNCRLTILMPIILLMYLDYGREIRITKIRTYFYQNRTLLMSILLIPSLKFVSKLTEFLFGLNQDISVGKTYESELLLFLNDLKNVDVINGILIVFSILFLLLKLGFRTLLVLPLSIAIYSVFAPKQAFGVPIYKSEILAPYVMVGLFGLFHLAQHGRKSASLVSAYVLRFTTTALLTCIAILNVENRVTPYPNYSWSQENLAGSTTWPYGFITYGKVDYGPIAENFSKYSDCKFKDIVYRGAFLLDSKIDVNTYVKFADRLQLDSGNLTENRGISCVIVGNASVEEFRKLNRISKLDLREVEVFNNTILKTKVFVFRK